MPAPQGGRSFEAACFKTTRGDTIRIHAKFPATNPDGALDLITTALAKTDIFKQIGIEHPTIDK